MAKLICLFSKHEQQQSCVSQDHCFSWFENKNIINTRSLFFLFWKQEYHPSYLLAPTWSNTRHLRNMLVRWASSDTFSINSYKPDSNRHIRRRSRSILTHWVMHICVGNLNVIGSDNGLLPGRQQAIIWTSAGKLLIGPLGTNFSEISMKILTFSFKKLHLNVSSAK